MADGGDAGVVGEFELWAIDFVLLAEFGLELVSVADHGAELDASEGASVKAFALVGEEDRSAVIGFDDEGDDGADGEGDQEGEEGEGDVEEAFGEVIDGPGTRGRSDEVGGGSGIRGEAEDRFGAGADEGAGGMPGVSGEGGGDIAEGAVDFPDGGEECGASRSGVFLGEVTCDAEDASAAVGVELEMFAVGGGLALGGEEKGAGACGAEGGEGIEEGVEGHGLRQMECVARGSGGGRRVAIGDAQDAGETGAFEGGHEFRGAVSRIRAAAAGGRKMAGEGGHGCLGSSGVGAAGPGGGDQPLSEGSMTPTSAATSAAAASTVVGVWPPSASTVSSAASLA